MTNYLRKMLTDAEEAGLKIIVDGGDPEPDYEGFHAAAAEEAATACDELHVYLYDKDRQVGWALIVNSLEPDEVIADCREDDWVDQWLAKNIHLEIA